MYRNDSTIQTTLEIVEVNVTNRNLEVYGVGNPNISVVNLTKETRGETIIFR